MHGKKWITPLMLTVLLGACAVTIGLDMGNMIGVNSEGHFVKDLTYQISSSSLVSFKTDGSFLSEDYAYETASDLDGDGVTNEGWILTGGTRGTYNYDADTYVATSTMTEVLDSVSGNPLAWLPNTNKSAPKLFAGTGAAFEHIIYLDFQPWEFLSVLVKSSNTANTWIGHTAITFNSEAKMEIINTVLIDTAAEHFTHTITTNQYLSNTLKYSTEIKRDGTIDGTMPADATWKKGESVSFILTGTLSRRVFDGSSWSSWVTDEEQNKINLTYTHMGDFIIFFANQTPMRTSDIVLGGEK